MQKTTRTMERSTYQSVVWARPCINMGTRACLCFSTGCRSAALDPGEAGTRGGGTP